MEREGTWGLTDQKSRQDSGDGPQAGLAGRLEKVGGQQQKDDVLQQHDLRGPKGESPPKVMCTWPRGRSS